MICKKCGKEIADNMKFCPNCGAEITQEQPVQNVTQTQSNDKDKQKKLSSRATLVLKKDGAKNITINCPRKIKMGFFQTLLEIRFGIPPLDVKPIDVKGLIITAVAFISLFIVPFIFSFSVPVVLLELVILAFNIWYTKNYFYTFINKKLKDGYIAADESTLEVLKDSNLPEPEKDKKTRKIINIVFYIIMGIFFILSICCNGSSISNIEKSALPLVNQIIDNNYGEFGAECLSVEILGKTSDGRYTGEAYLDNGNTLNLIITDYGDTINVKIPEL